MIVTIYEKTMNLIVIISVLYCIYSFIKYIRQTVKQYWEVQEGDTFLYTQSFNNEIPVVVLSKKWGFILVSYYKTNDDTHSHTLCKPHYVFFPLFILDSVKIK